MGPLFDRDQAKTDWLRAYSDADPHHDTNSNEELAFSYGFRAAERQAWKLFDEFRKAFQFLSENMPGSCTCNPQGGTECDYCGVLRVVEHQLTLADGN